MKMEAKVLLLSIAGWLFAASGCGSETPHDACSRVGSSFCAKVYACSTAEERQQLNFPASEADCVAQENANCSNSSPKPGYCKGHAQVSDKAANACADELDAMSCQVFNTSTSSGACKAQLCAQ
jgi:hypothetical protein